MKKIKLLQLFWSKILPIVFLVFLLVPQTVVLGSETSQEASVITTEYTVNSKFDSFVNSVVSFVKGIFHIKKTATVTSTKVTKQVVVSTVTKNPVVNQISETSHNTTNNSFDNSNKNTTTIVKTIEPRNTIIYKTDQSVLNRLQNIEQSIINNISFNSRQIDAVYKSMSRSSSSDNTDPQNINQNESYRFVTDAEKTTWNEKQAELVSGANIKTINGVSLLGSGNISIVGAGGVESDPVFTDWDKSTGISIAKSQISDFPTSMPASDVSAWAKAATKPTYSWSEISSHPTLLSQFTNDLGNYGGFLTSYTETDPTISAWAKAATKPSYIWTEIGSRPTKLSQFENDLGIGNTETDPIYLAWNKSDGISITKSQVSDFPTTLSSFTNDLGNYGNFLTSYTETDPTISSWAKAATKPTYTKSEVGLGNVDNTSDLNKPISTATQAALDLKQPVGSYLTSYTETDPIYSAWNKSTGINITKSQISDFPNTLSSFTNDLGNYGGFLTSYTETDPTISSWAKQAVKPSYTWTEIGSRPTALSQFTNDLGNYGGFLTSYTESDPTISSWAKAATKPTYTASEVGAPSGSGASTGINTGDQDLSGLVPYTGATGDLNLGSNSLEAGYITTKDAFEFNVPDSNLWELSTWNQGMYFNNLTTGNDNLVIYNNGNVQAHGTLTASNLSGTNTGDNAVNSNYANDYRASNFVAGTNYLAPNGSAAALTNFPTLNQNTTGTSAGLSSAYIDWNASSGGASILNKPTIPSITGLVPYTGASSNVDLGTHALTVNGITTTGDISITGSIIPSADDTYDLGSPTKMWRNLYVGAHSIYVNGQEVLQTDPSDNVVVSADINQNLNIKTTGTGNIELNPSGVGGQILLKNDVTISAGKFIRTSDASQLIFSDGSKSGNISISANIISAINTNGGIEIAPNGTGNTYITNGNLGIGNSGPTEKLDVTGNIKASGTILGSNLSGSNTGDETQTSIKTKLGSAGASTDGYLTSTDWNTFNNKQPAGNYLTSYTETDPTIYAWAKAENKPSYSASEIGLGNVTNESKVTLFTNPSFTGNALVGGTLTVADTATTKTYSSFGSNSTNHSLSNPYDVLFSGNVEIDGNLFLDAASIELSSTTISDDLQVDGVLKLSDGTALNPSYTFTNDTDTGLFRSGVNSLSFITGGNERMSISSAGVVNVNGTISASNISGTNTGDQDLSGYVPYTGANTNIVLGANTLSTTSGLITPKIYPSADSTTAFQINKADGITNVFNIDTTNGRVGIGTTTPGYKLEVNGATRINGDITTAGGSKLAVGVGMGSYGITASSAEITSVLYTPQVGSLSGTFRIVTSGRANPVTINDNFYVGNTDHGNIGIGTTTPLSKLSINGGLHVGGDSDAGDNNILADGTITAVGNITGANLSGTNTGDQDLSGLVTKTTTVNGHALSGDVSVTASDVGLGNVTNNPQWYSGNHPTTISGYGITDAQSTLGGTGIVKSTAGTISYLTDNSSNWNTAYSWGNHAGLYSDINHFHTVIKPVTMYTWDGNSTPDTYTTGIQTSFANTNFPNYGTVLTVKSHDSLASGIFQIYGPHGPDYGGTSLKYRLGVGQSGGNSWSNWKTVWDNENFDPSSKLGLHATADNSAQWNGYNNGFGDFAYLVDNLSTIVGFHPNGIAYRFNSDAVKTWLGLGSNAYTSTSYWHAGNDGSGSGLDADLLDGQSGAYYLDNTDSQILGTSGNTITLTNGGSVTAPYATSAGNADTVDNLHASQIFNNMGVTHSTQTDFNSISDFGFRFVQGTGNGPGTGSSQFYGMSLGLGNEYPFSSYALQMAIPRYTGDDKYLSIRAREAGTWGSWTKISAGYADSAGNASSATTAGSLSLTGGSTLTIGSYDRNLKYKGGSSNDVGMSFYNSSNTWLAQIYADAGSYGFLNSDWGGWDVQKIRGGNLVINGNQQVITSASIGSQSVNYATSAGSLSNGLGGFLSHPGNGSMGFGYAYNYQSTPGIFPSVDNSNAILNINRHPGEYNSQLGFSSNGNMYYRSYSGTAIETTQPWRLIIDSGNIGSQSVNYATSASTATTATNVNGGIVVTANAASTWGDIQTGSIDSNYVYAYDSLCTNNNSGTCNGPNGVVIGRDNDAAYTNFPSTGASFISGSLGVGTASPGSKLEVDTYDVFGTDIIKVKDTHYNITSGLGIDGMGTYWGTSLMQGGTQAFTVESNRGILVGTNYQDDNAPANGAIIEGSVGIGTTTPNGKLQVQGYVRIQDPSSNDKGILAFGNAANGADYYDTGIYRGSIGSLTAGNYLNMSGYAGLAFNTSAAALGSQTTRMYIDGTSGNVGIGTTSPGTKLDVRRSDNNAGDAIAFGSQSYYMGRLGEDPNINLVYLANTYMSAPIIDFRLGGTSSGNSKMIIKGDNVGIGTTSPGVKLDVVGSMYVRSGVFYADTIAGYSAGVVNLAANTNLIVPSGYVGIGRTDPSRKLDILGAHGDTTMRLYSTGDGGSNDSSLDMWASEPSWTYDGAGIGYNVNGHPAYGRRNTGKGQSFIRFTGNGDMSFSSGSGNATGRMTLTAAGDLNMGGTGAFSFGDYGGGWYMADTGWMRSVNSKSIWLGSGTIGTNGNLTVGYGGNSGPDTGAIIAGGVGIGSSSPKHKLDVVGNVGIGAVASNYSDEGYNLHIWSSDIGSYPYGHGSQPANIAIEENDAEQSLAFLGPDYSIQKIVFGESSNNAEGYIQYDHSYATYGIMGGNVGIGMTDPGGYTLNVNGSIGSTSVNTGDIVSSSLYSTGEISSSNSDVRAWTGLYTNTGNIETGSGDVIANGTILYSDRTLKDNINEIPNIDKFMNVKFHQFNYKSVPGELRYGVIAQELQEFAPELVHETETGKLAVNYNDLFVGKFAYNDKLMDEQQRKIENIQSELFKYTSIDTNLMKNITTLEDKEYTLQTFGDDIKNSSISNKLMSLSVVKYNTTNETDTDPKHITLITDELIQLFPESIITDPETGHQTISYTSLIPYTVKAIQDMNLQFTEINNMEKENSIRTALTSWFSNAANGITSFFAKEIHTEKVCVKKSDGSEICMTGDEFSKVMGASAVPIETQEPVVETPVAPVEETPAPIVEDPNATVTTTTTTTTTMTTVTTAEVPIESVTTPTEATTPTSTE